MADIVQNLVKLLSVTKISENRFEGRTQDLGFKNLFGGHVLGQAVMAASATTDHYKIHSLHAYFLRPGDVSEPVGYEVERIRDGQSFATRRVVAMQKGKAIFNFSGSFQKEEPGFSHQEAMPFVPGPENFLSDLEIARKHRDKIPERLREKFTCDRPIEIRTVDPINYFKPQKRPPVKYCWLKTLTPPVDNATVRQALLAYASDFGLIGTAMLPHGVSFVQPNMQVASLDHAMWFHEDCPMDDWLLYCMTSPSASHARGLVNGKIFTRDGKLVASVVQEGLIRQLTEK